MLIYLSWYIKSLQCARKNVTEALLRNINNYLKKEKIALLKN